MSGVFCFCLFGWLVGCFLLLFFFGEGGGGGGCYLFLFYSGIFVLFWVFCFWVWVCGLGFVFFSGGRGECYQINVHKTHVCGEVETMSKKKKKKKKKDQRVQPLYQCIRTDLHFSNTRT